MAKVISILNSKGGTGKTTATFTLALFLASEGVKVAVVDVDPQGSLSHLSSVLDLIELEDIGKTDHQLILIDSPPYLSDQIPGIIERSNFVLVPILPSMVDIMASRQIINEIIRSGKKYGLVLNRVKPGTKVTGELQELLEAQNYELLTTTLFDRVSYQRAFAFKSLSLTEDPKMMNEIELLAGEIFRKLSL